MNDTGKSGSEPLDMFDFDAEIDFETAYQMLSNLDESWVPLHDTGPIALGKDPNQPHFTNEFDDFDKLFPQNASYDHKKENDILNGTAGMYDHSISNHDVLHHNHIPHQTHSIDKSPLLIHDQFSKYDTESPGLLSTFESNAIENFLDNLITRDNVTPPLPLVPELRHPPSTDNEVSSSAEFIYRETSEEKELSLEETNDEEYRPAELRLPEIVVPDTDIPESIKDDAVKLKRWRHVEVEKVRRNLTKKAYEDLIGMIRKPRNENGKRIPKYVLLNHIVEDIKGIKKANRKLENILNAMNG
ncbi:hypothetical protein NCAS_0B03730 [Naumovozyma castellii]|uniref:BHLH domain-containing protein n=1 Tax=Naumovozyma castellii TaxID=27288 RepID=G0VBY0_NAUCA|nr:hypothetical protein NCAS_0B03730 [Naumovozyma castellii CBS 4309]CCC68457.1 hypothetical protein NCAS_0B03730 [Naumovozyma castellii CBS 4309]